MSTARKGTILSIDDEEIMREILETLLTREGYDVRLASSGAEGLELARALPFDAAIVDIMMPGLDGIATLDELKRIDEDLAVIIITAYGSIESAIAAMIRTSTLIVSMPPRRMKSRSWITRSSFACVSSGTLPISSKKMLPLSARSNSPFFG